MDSPGASNNPVQRKRRSRQPAGSPRNDAALGGPPTPSDAIPENERDAAATSGTSPREANASVAFAQLLRKRLEPRQTDQRRRATSWNIVGMSEERQDLPSELTRIITKDQMNRLAESYFGSIHQLYGFLNRQVFEDKVEERWQMVYEPDAWDSILCGVAALGSQFLGESSKALEMALVDCAKRMLEITSASNTPSFENAASWILRTIYLRIEIFKLLPAHLISRAGDFTPELLYLYKISERLDPRKPSTAQDFEAGIAELATFNPPVDGLFLSQSNLALALYRRLRFVSSTISDETIRRVITMGNTGLDAAVGESFPTRSLTETLAMVRKLIQLACKQKRGQLSLLEHSLTPRPPLTTSEQPKLQFSTGQNCYASSTWADHSPASTDFSDFDWEKFFSMDVSVLEYPAPLP
ncbi:protein RDR1 [Diplocarpon rosae]|nr:protein RDR1 [Diplocarpon rosae]